MCRLPDGFENRVNLPCVSQERRTGAGFNHFFHGTAHVDVQDVESPVRYEFGCFGKDISIGPEDLHAQGSVLGRGVKVVMGFAGSLLQADSADHFRESKPNTVFPVEAPERKIGDPCHGRQKDIVFQRQGSDFDGPEAQRADLS